MDDVVGRVADFLTIGDVCRWRTTCKDIDSVLACRVDIYKNNTRQRAKDTLQRSFAMSEQQASRVVSKDRDDVRPHVLLDILSAIPHPYFNSAEEKAVVEVNQMERRIERRLIRRRAFHMLMDDQHVLAESHSPCTTTDDAQLWMQSWDNFAASMMTRCQRYSFQRLFMQARAFILSIKSQCTMTFNYTRFGSRLAGELLDAVTRPRIPVLISTTWPRPIVTKHPWVEKGQVFHQSREHGLRQEGYYSRSGDTYAFDTVYVALYDDKVGKQVTQYVLQFLIVS